MWREEYLTTLRELTKNYCVKRDLKKGNLVLDLLAYKLKNFRNFWPLAVVKLSLKGIVAGQEDKVRSKWLRLPDSRLKSNKGRKTADAA